MLETTGLKEKLRSKIPENKNLIFSCGSGITACVLALAAEQSQVIKIYRFMMAHGQNGEVYQNFRSKKGIRLK